MKKNEYTVSGHGEGLVDCRNICMEIGFNMLAPESLKVLALEYTDLLNDIFEENAIIRYNWDRRKVKLSKIPDLIRSSDGFMRFYFDGDIISDTVYDIKSFNKYDKMLRFGFSGNGLDNLVSADYKETFCEFFSGISQPEDIKKALMKIFGEQDRKMFSIHSGHDIGGSFYSRPHSNDSKKFWGSIELNIALTKVDDQKVQIVSLFEDWLRRITSDIGNITARILLSPILGASSYCGHMKYFGDNLNTDVSYKHEQSRHLEFDPYYYLYGAEWLNVISPIQMTHLPDLMRKSADYRNIIVEELPGGSFIVKSAKSIFETDIDIYTDLKSVLYNALYPGKSTIMLENLFSRDKLKWGYGCKPRYEWEYVPIFEDEIEVLEDRVVFRHKNNV